MAKRMRKATIRQKSPMASERAKPRMAYEKSCCFREGFLGEEEEKRLNFLSTQRKEHQRWAQGEFIPCLLYTSDAADDTCVV